MQYKQPYKERLKEHVFYLGKLFFWIFITGCMVFWIYTKYSNTDVVLLWFGLALSLIMMIAGVVLLLNNYIPFVLYTSSEDSLEVEGNNLWIHSTKKGGSKVSFPLNRVVTFNHFTQRNNAIELITVQGDELFLEGYEHMEELIRELVQSPAGKHYALKN